MEKCSYDSFNVSCGTCRFGWASDPNNPGGECLGEIFFVKLT